MAYAVAAIAASVGVNTPVVMPPTRMMGVSSGKKARLKVVQRLTMENFASRCQPRVWA